MAIFIALIYGLFCFAIGEFFGRAKHIGRWWTMFLFWSAPIPIVGLLALTLSPSAMDSHKVRYNKSWICLGVIFFILAIIFIPNLFSSSALLKRFSWVFFPFSVIHGFYFIFLGSGVIQNQNPKFYIKRKKRSNASLTRDVDKDLNDLLQKGIITNEEYSLYKSRQEQVDQKKEAEENKRRVAEERKNAQNKLMALYRSGILTDTEYSSKLSELSREIEIIKPEEEQRVTINYSDVLLAAILTIGFLVMMFMFYFLNLVL